MRREEAATTPAGPGTAGPPSTTASQDLPSSPTRLGGSGWLAAARRSAREFRVDFLQDRAAALTYVRQIILHAVANLQRSHGSAGLFAIVGLVLAAWSASGYVAAFMRAANAIYDVPEGRPAWKTMPIRFGVTLMLLLMLLAAGIIVVVTGSLARHVGQVLGIGSAAVTAWDIAKWPVLVIIFCVMLGVLYWASPNAKHGFRWVIPGGVIAMAGWLIASGLFALYVANFGHYNKVYGSIAGVIIFLIWMWISNLIILFGAEFNAELERGRAIAAGTPADREPFVELRDTRKLRRRSG